MDGKTNKKRSSADRTKKYCVEKVLGEKTRNGKSEYLIKWRGFPSTMNSWEPQENLSTTLIASIKKLKEEISDEKNIESNSTPSQLTLKERGSSNQDEGMTPPSISSDQAMQEIAEKIDKADADTDDNYEYGFERGLEPEKILGVSKDTDELMFLFKWKNSFEGEFVPAKIANIRFPELVIQYYEEITMWED